MGRDLVPETGARSCTASRKSKLVAPILSIRELMLGCDLSWANVKRAEALTPPTNAYLLNRPALWTLL
jgi:hypothetical protein